MRKRQTLVSDQVILTAMRGWATVLWNPFEHSPRKRHTGLERVIELVKK